MGDIAMYTRTKTLLGADTSNVTSAPYFTGDFRQMTISVTTGSAFASRITVQASNADGFQSTLSSGGGYGNSTIPSGVWSHLTVILPVSAANVFSIDTIPRWICVVRPTQASGQTASNNTVIVTGRT